MTEREQRNVQVLTALAWRPTMLKHLFRCFAGPPSLQLAEQPEDHVPPSKTSRPHAPQTVINEAGECPAAASVISDLQRNLSRLRPPGAAALVALLPVAEAAALLLASDGSDWLRCAPDIPTVPPPPPPQHTTPGSSLPGTAYRALTLAASPGFSVLFNGARTSRSCDALMHLLLSADGRACAYFGQAAVRAVAAAAAHGDTAATAGTSGEQGSLDLGGHYGWSLTATPLAACGSEGGRVFPALLVSWPSFLPPPAPPPPPHRHTQG